MISVVYGLNFSAHAVSAFNQFNKEIVISPINPSSGRPSPGGNRPAGGRPGAPGSRPAGTGNRTNTPGSRPAGAAGTKSAAPGAKPGTPGAKPGAPGSRPSTPGGPRPAGGNNKSRGRKFRGNSGSKRGRGNNTWKKNPSEEEEDGEGQIQLEGVISSVLAGTMFRVKLGTGHEVLAHISGKMRKRFIRLVVGDKVRMEMSPYDTTKARITFRIG